MCFNKNKVAVSSARGGNYKLVASESNSTWFLIGITQTKPDIYPELQIRGDGENIHLKVNYTLK
jgi:hypothetical protein